MEASEVWEEVFQSWKYSHHLQAIYVPQEMMPSPQTLYRSLGQKPRFLPHHQFTKLSAHNLGHVVIACRKKNPLVLSHHYNSHMYSRQKVIMLNAAAMSPNSL